MLPLDAGVRLTFASGGGMRPYLAGGASYFLLDSDFGEVSDELGDSAAVGATFGDARGADFFVEGRWRKATARFEIDPERLDDLDVEGHADVDSKASGSTSGSAGTSETGPGGGDETHAPVAALWFLPRSHFAAQVLTALPAGKAGVYARTLVTIHRFRTVARAGRSHRGGFT